MAAGMDTKRRGIGWLIRSPEQTDAYSRAALLSIAVAAGLAGLAYFASQLTVSTGTILLFARAEWPFWALGLALTLGAGGRAAPGAPRARPGGTGPAPRPAPPPPPTPPTFPALPPPPRG